ncbi:cysteine desulfurase family protein [Acinetobacter lactucae]|uniref:cysteine desulfurase family protein n=1 Tax=Acinetobacter lactucae TaxID=1785128 RepID=UPI00077E3949
MNKLIYLDYAATTPIDKKVIEKMMQYMGFSSNFGNPASITHYYGQNAAQAVEYARKQVADLISAKPQDIIWTSGATESNNLALKGIAYQYVNKGRHIVTSQIEHKAILDTCSELEKQGFIITYLKPEPSTGLISPTLVKSALRPDTILVSLMMVNNEIGTLTDIEAIAEIVKKNGSIFHVDAAQAAGKVEIDLTNTKIDLMSFSAHKVYGPKGVGALYIHPKIQLKAQIHGGGHEKGMRSGTLATHQIVGMGAAFALAKQKIKSEQIRLSLLRKKLYEGFQSLTLVKLNGHPTQHVANYLNISFLDVHANAIISAIQLIAAVSSGSACNSHQLVPSHVLSAIDVPSDLVKRTVRFSLGEYTTEQDIQQILKAISDVKKSYQTFF